MSEFIASLKLDDPRTVLHWYDFLCPFCYVGQSRDVILKRHALTVIELPYQAHPDIPPGGVAAGARNGPMYAQLERQAEEAGLPLRWPSRLPNTRRALAAAEWVRLAYPDLSEQLNKDLFSAHFAQGEDLGDPAVIDRHAQALGVDLDALHAALAEPGAEAAVARSEALGQEFGVRGTPAWWLSGQLISGLLPAADFERLAASISPCPPAKHSG
jgi:predicted DsbA family dithiol-disulfide isomerase